MQRSIVDTEVTNQGSTYCPTGKYASLWERNPLFRLDIIHKKKIMTNCRAITKQRTKKNSNITFWADKWKLKPYSDCWPRKKKKNLFSIYCGWCVCFEGTWNPLHSIWYENFQTVKTRPCDKKCTGSQTTASTQQLKQTVLKCPARASQRGRLKEKKTY